MTVSGALMEIGLLFLLLSIQVVSTEATEDGKDSPATVTLSINSTRSPTAPNNEQKNDIDNDDDSSRERRRTKTNPQNQGTDHAQITTMRNLHPRIAKAIKSYLRNQHISLSTLDRPTLLKLKKLYSSAAMKKKRKKRRRRRKRKRRKKKKSPSKLGGLTNKRKSGGVEETILPLPRTGASPPQKMPHQQQDKDKAYHPPPDSSTQKEQSQSSHKTSQIHTVHPVHEVVRTLPEMIDSSGEKIHSTHEKYHNSQKEVAASGEKVLVLKNVAKNDNQDDAENVDMFPKTNMLAEKSGSEKKKNKFVKTFPVHHAKTNGGVRYDEQRKTKKNGGVRNDEQRKTKTNGGVRHDEQRKTKKNGGVRNDEQRKTKINGGVRNDEQRKTKTNGGVRHDEQRKSKKLDKNNMVDSIVAAQHVQNVNWPSQTNTAVQDTVKPHKEKTMKMPVDKQDDQDKSTVKVKESKQTAAQTKLHDMDGSAGRHPSMKEDNFKTNQQLDINTLSANIIKQVRKLPIKTEPKISKTEHFKKTNTQKISHLDHNGDQLDDLTSVVDHYSNELSQEEAILSQIIADTKKTVDLFDNQDIMALQRNTDGYKIGGEKPHQPASEEKTIFSTQEQQPQTTISVKSYADTKDSEEQLRIQGIRPMGDIHRVNKEHSLATNRNTTNYIKQLIDPPLPKKTIQNSIPHPHHYLLSSNDTDSPRSLQNLENALQTRQNVGISNENHKPVTHNGQTQINETATENLISVWNPMNTKQRVLENDNRKDMRLKFPETVISANRKQVTTSENNPGKLSLINKIHSNQHLSMAHRKTNATEPRLPFTTNTTKADVKHYLPVRTKTSNDKEVVVLNKDIRQSSVLNEQITDLDLPLSVTDNKDQDVENPLRGTGSTGKFKQIQPVINTDLNHHEGLADSDTKDQNHRQHEMHSDLTNLRQDQPVGNSDTTGRRQDQPVGNSDATDRRRDQPMGNSDTTGQRQDQPMMNSDVADRRQDQPMGNIDIIDLKQDQPTVNSDITDRRQDQPTVNSDITDLNLGQPGRIEGKITDEIKNQPLVNKGQVEQMQRQSVVNGKIINALKSQSMTYNNITNEEQSQSLTNTDITGQLMSRLLAKNDARNQLQNQVVATIDKTNPFKNKPLANTGVANHIQNRLLTTYGMMNQMQSQHPANSDTTIQIQSQPFANNDMANQIHSQTQTNYITEVKQLRQPIDNSTIMKQNQPHHVPSNYVTALKQRFSIINAISEDSDRRIESDDTNKQSDDSNKQSDSINKQPMVQLADTSTVIPATAVGHPKSSDQDSSGMNYAPPAESSNAVNSPQISGATNDNNAAKTEIVAVQELDKPAVGTMLAGNYHNQERLPITRKTDVQVKSHVMMGDVYDQGYPKQDAFTISAPTVRKTYLTTQVRTVMKKSNDTTTMQNQQQTALKTETKPTHKTQGHHVSLIQKLQRVRRPYFSQQTSHDRLEPRRYLHQEQTSVDYQREGTAFPRIRNITMNRVFPHALPAHLHSLPFRKLLPMTGSGNSSALWTVHAGSKGGSDDELLKEDEDNSTYPRNRSFFGSGFVSYRSLVTSLGLGTTLLVFCCFLCVCGVTRWHRLRQYRKAFNKVEKSFSDLDLDKPFYIRLARLRRSPAGNQYVITIVDDSKFSVVEHDLESEDEIFDVTDIVTADKKGPLARLQWTNQNIPY